MIASATAAGRGEDVTVIEKNSRPARKVMITGKGRCNVTNACFDLDDLINSVVTNKRFMYSAFSSFMPYDTIALIEEMGVPTKIERGNRVFPESDKAVDIVDALVKMQSKTELSLLRALSLHLTQKTMLSNRSILMMELLLTVMLLQFVQAV